MEKKNKNKSQTDNFEIFRNNTSFYLFMKKWLKMIKTEYIADSVN